MSAEAYPIRSGVRSLEDIRKELQKLGLWLDNIDDRLGGTDSEGGGPSSDLLVAELSINSGGTGHKLHFDETEFVVSMEDGSAATTGGTMAVDVGAIAATKLTGSTTAILLGRYSAGAGGIQEIGKASLGNDAGFGSTDELLGWSSTGSLATFGPSLFYDYKILVTDSGTATASQVGDTATIAGGTGISTSASGDTITITNSAPAGGGSDTDAIHDNVAAEISAITAKTVPVSGDYFVIEDSAASNAKKALTFGNLQAQIDHTGILNIGSNSHATIDTHLASTSNPHSTTIVNLTDTTIDGPENLDLLQYDSVSSKWVDRTLAEAGIAAASHTHAVTDLTDGDAWDVLGTESDGSTVAWQTATGTNAPVRATSPVLVTPTLNDDGGYDILGLIKGAATAVNYISVVNAATGTSPYITVSQSSDGDVDLRMDAKGGGRVILVNGEGFVFPDVSSDPTTVTPDEGQVYFNSVSKVLRLYDGTSWGDVGSGAGITELYTAVSKQTLIASSTITATDGSPYTPIDSASAITLTSEPHIAAGRNGQKVTLVNVGSYNITLQDVNNLGGALMRFTANTLTIQPAGTLCLEYDSTVGFWCEKYILNPQTFTPSISSLTSDLATTREIAAASTLDSKPQFTIAYVGTPSACSIDVDAGDPGTDWPITVPSPYTALTDGTTPPTDDFYRQTSHNSTRVMTATATVAGQAGLTKTLTFTYYNRRYCGPNTQSTILSSAQILALDDTAAGTSSLANSTLTTYSNIDTTTGEYIWIAHRDAFGTHPSYFSVENTGGTGGTNGNEIAAFSNIGTVSHTNDYGANETYRCYRSTNTNFGSNKDVVTSSSQPNNRIYVGPSTDADPISSANILTIDDTADGYSKVASTVAGTYVVTISTGEYLWVCHPDRVTDIATIKDNATGFAIAGAYGTDVSHTNDNGYTETYRCWVSDNTAIFPSGGTVVIT